MLALSYPLILTSVAADAEHLMAFEVSIPIRAVTGATGTTFRRWSTIADLRRYLVDCSGF